jgi:hypothetical protein
MADYMPMAEAERIVGDVVEQAFKATIKTTGARQRCLIHMIKYLNGVMSPGELRMVLKESVPDVFTVQARDACAAESQEEIFEQEEHARQRGIIEGVNEWADMAEISVLLLGTDSDRHIYADAILGTITTPRPAVLYSREKVIEAMVRESDGGTWQEMEEFYEYNTVRSLQYMSAEDNPPILVDEVVS